MEEESMKLLNNLSLNTSHWGIILKNISHDNIAACVVCGIDLETKKGYEIAKLSSNQIIKKCSNRLEVGSYEHYACCIPGLNESDKFDDKGWLIGSEMSINNKSIK